MGLLAEAIRGINPLRRAVIPMAATVNSFEGAARSAPTGYQASVRSGYMGNELIFAGIDLLATSAAEPEIVGRRYPRGTRAAARRYERYLIHSGASRAMVPAALAAKGLAETVTDNPLVQVLNNPNPFASRFHLWSTLIMDRYLAGNAYVYVLGGRASPQELWRLRPDRVKVIPDKANFIGGYEYRLSQEEVYALRPDEVLHFKARHPLDEYYGMPPLLPLMPRLSIDNYMRDFVSAFFQNGANPGAVLAVKQRLSQEAKDDIRLRLRRQTSGVGGWFETLVLDQAEASWTPMTMALGARGLAAPELSNITEARIAATLGIPASILGALVGLESSSYANKKADWNVFWDVTLAPLYSDLDDTLNLGLMPGAGLDAVEFDLSQVKALAEDVDHMHERARANVIAGIWTLEEARMLTGVDPLPQAGHFLLPSAGILTPVESLDAPPPSASPPAAPEPEPEPRSIAAEARCPRCHKLAGTGVNHGARLYCARCRDPFDVELLTEALEPVLAS